MSPDYKTAEGECLFLSKKGRSILLQGPLLKKELKTEAPEIMLESVNIGWP